MNDRENYWYDKSAGRGTYAYVLSSGVAALHQEFEGRARLAFNALPGQSNYDTSGHGTYVAGVIGGKTHGVAKKTNILAVKILHGKETTVSTVIHGLQWATRDIISRRRKQDAVLHLSVAGNFNEALNNAIDAAHNQGIICVVPAGNNGIDANGVSPASANGALTVGATDASRKRVGFSNWGSRISIFAPGVNVCSAWPGSNRRKTHRASGTASAAAIVAGLVVYFKGYNSLWTPAETWELISLAATRDVTRNKGGKPALFAYNFSTK